MTGDPDGFRIPHRGVVVTGGAGFVGSSLCLLLREAEGSRRVVAFDNLKRRGSELNLSRLREAGVEFVHGDVRSPEDLAALTGELDLLIDCSAEPSVLAGRGESPAYVVQTNLVGTANCLEWARPRGADVVFLSTSRVYPIEPQNRLVLVERESRFELADGQPFPGASSRGISESFPLEGARSIYGATKLASELLVEEYRATYGLRTIVNRCGVLAGPWQMGKVDQGVFTLWVLAHLFDRPLSYIGYGGSGKQVRDVMHVRDLFELLRIELARLNELSGSVFNVGGGRAISLSLRETTELCQQLTKKTVPVEPVLQNRFADVPVYLTDTALVEKRTGWAPRVTAPELMLEIVRWASDHGSALKSALG
jgi:CDP-paratose 2-epimerase